MPELILLQMGFWGLPILLSKPWRQRVIARMKALPFELGESNRTYPVSQARLLLHIAFSVISALPLAAVLGAYRQRLGMTYHTATYIGNLGLDHRNGWAAIGGLVTSFASVVLAAGLAVTLALGEARASGASEQPETISEANDSRGRAAKGASGLQLWILGRVGKIDWPAVSEVVYTSLIHQILLAVTNHLVPIMVLIRAWYLLIVIGVLIYWLYTKKGVSKEVLGLATAVAFVAWTATVQIWGDSIELWRCVHDIVQPWNYRWAVRDWLSTNAKQVQ
jgi:hypothetical protein